MTQAQRAPLVAVVDDDGLFRRSVERLLKASGFRVETFGSAEAFLQRNDEAATSCAILDVKLPGMSGPDLQRRLAHTMARPPIVFVSAHDEPAVRANVLGAGAIAFLKKPFEDSALLDALRAAIR